MSIRVLFITRPTVFSGPGGDTIQLLKTKQYLMSNFNIQVDIADESRPQLEGFDLIHFFNLRNPQDLLWNVRNARKLKIPMLLSTIWGSYLECDQKARSGLPSFIAKHVSESMIEYLKVIMRALINNNFNKNMIPYLLNGHKRSQREIALSMDSLLPNSPTEFQRVKRDLNLQSVAGAWVANAVDLNIFNSSEVSVDDKFKKFSGCILSAARVEIRKCQLDLIKAVKNLPYKLVIVGKPSPNSIDYYNKCKEYASDNVFFIEHVSQSELAQLYKVAKTHALISWMETPGLSSLEAAVMDCNVIVTDRGDTKFYFEDLVTYVEPGDVDSIKSGIADAMEKVYNPELKNKIIENFTWLQTAEQTYNEYLRVIESKKEHR